MNHEIFNHACRFLQILGIPYEALISPFWSEAQDGVVLPTLGKVIPRMEPERHYCSWDEAMADAAAAGLALPSREELQYIHSHIDQINGLLLAHDGNRLPRSKHYWACTEFSHSYAWSANFGSGGMNGHHKGNAMYSRPLAELKNFNVKK